VIGRPVLMRGLHRVTRGLERAPQVRVVQAGCGPDGLAQLPADQDKGPTLPSEEGNPVFAHGFTDGWSLSVVNVRGESIR
jgi:hypothetical protein